MTGDLLIWLITFGCAIGGYLVGRMTSRDTYVEKVRTLLATEHNTLSLYQALGPEFSDPLTVQALARLYDVPLGDRDALVKRLSHVAWVPPYRPAPFVGHMAKPILGEDLRINMLGFRDERQSYETKPDRTMRIFLTGGSTAWGSGASSQKTTISSVLEQILNDRLFEPTGYRYEVVNTAFPAWSTTQEKLLIQQRLADMHPDVVVMLSGNNDVHWSLNSRDIRWFYTYYDQNYLTLFNELYKSAAHPEWTFTVPLSTRAFECSDLGRMTARNVEDALLATDRANARLIFVLQPNIVSTAKRLTKHERRILAKQNIFYWNSCYQAMRDELSRISARNFRLLDLSRSFGALDDTNELFIDAYHFADLGYRLIAEALADQIDWQAMIPAAAHARQNNP